MTAQLPISTSPQPARLTARDFWLLADAGAFEGFVKAELIEGEIQVVNAVHSRHACAHAVLTGELYAVLKSGPLILLSTPSTALSDESIPEPDIAVARAASGKVIDGRDLLLAIEISDSTYAFDSGPKLKLYAQHGVPEYWVVNLDRRAIQQHWRPEGNGYLKSREIRFGDDVRAETIDGLAVEGTALASLI